MARICDICEKGGQMANPRKLLRGHLNPRGKKKQYPNLQSKMVDGKRIKACTKCFKTMAKNAV